MLPFLIVFLAAVAASTFLNQYFYATHQEVKDAIKTAFSLDPSFEANQILIIASKNLGKIQTSKVDITFTREFNNINVIAIAPGSGISPEQICLSEGDFTGQGIFENNNNKSIKYLGESLKNVNISVFCQAGTKLVKALANTPEALNPQFAADCQCTEKEDTCCLAALRLGTE